MPILITPPVVVCYPRFFKPSMRKNPKPTDRPMFSGSFLFDDDAMASPETKAILAALDEEARQKWGAVKADAMLREGSIKSPFRRDISKKGYPETYVRYISCSSGEDYPPKVLDRAGVAIVDPREFYHGTKVRVSLVARAYGGPGTPHDAGLQLDLRNVQKMGDGPRIVLGGDTDGSEFGTPQPAASAAGLTDLLA